MNEHLIGGFISELEKISQLYRKPAIGKRITSKTMKKPVIGKRITSRTVRVK